jgi:hypothetical protein
MKKGDLVILNHLGGKSTELTCIAMYGGTGYYGISGNVVISGTIWELLNNGTISLKHEHIRH